MANTRGLVNKPGMSIPIRPAVALASGNRFVTYDTDAMSVVLSAANDDSCGVVLAPYGPTDATSEMIVDGIVLIEAGAQVDPGWYVQAGTLGVAIHATTGNPVKGRCIVGCAGAGELISVHLSIPQNGTV